MNGQRNARQVIGWIVLVVAVAWLLMATATGITGFTIFLVDGYKANWVVNSIIVVTGVLWFRGHFHEWIAEGISWPRETLERYRQYDITSDWLNHNWRQIYDLLMCGQGIQIVTQDDYNKLTFNQIPPGQIAVSAETYALYKAAYRAQQEATRYSSEFNRSEVPPFQAERSDSEASPAQPNETVSDGGELNDPTLHFAEVVGTPINNDGQPLEINAGEGLVDDLNSEVEQRLIDSDDGAH